LRLEFVNTVIDTVNDILPFGPEFFVIFIVEVHGVGHNINEVHLVEVVFEDTFEVNSLNFQCC